MIDYRHSINATHEQVRWNLLLAYLLSQSPSACAAMAPELKQFLAGFCEAWQAALFAETCEDAQMCNDWVTEVWRHSNYDLIHWQGSHRVQIRATVKAMAAWAIQYFVYRNSATQEEKEEQQVKKEERELMRGLGKLDISKGPPEWLTEEMFRKPLVQALMTEVDKDVMVQDRENLTFWMTTGQSVAVMERKAEGMDSLEETFKVLTFLE